MNSVSQTFVSGAKRVLFLSLLLAVNPVVVFGKTITDDVFLRMPVAGDNELRVVSSNVVELTFITTRAPDPAPLTQWGFIDATGNGSPPAAGEFKVLVNGQAVTVASVGFKRRPLYAPLAVRDLRIGNYLYLQLGSPVPAGANVVVQNPDGTLWPGSTVFAAVSDPLRYSPAIHVNQVGYLPLLPKKAMVGYYLGSAGELPAATGGFSLVDSRSGAAVFQGTLTPRPDAGYSYTPTPYQQVLEADFSAYQTPGEYKLVVAGLGASLPFLIDEGVAAAWARTYALGMYHQRCGTNNVLPFTRFVHDDCHTAAASIPLPASAFANTWNFIQNYALETDPLQTAPSLTNAAAQLYPFVKQGTVDVSGGHHDAGDYSKYTINSALFIHYLVFTVDAVPGAAAVDNLGIPESGDGISDLLQEAKWEADFLAKLQDTDGGFYFLVYPRDRCYETDVLPDHGDPQVVFPKTTAVTAAAVGALADMASSPAFKAAYPVVASNYLYQAKLGWMFLTNAIGKYGCVRSCFSARCEAPVPY